MSKFYLKPFREDELRTAIEMALYKHSLDASLHETNRRLEQEIARCKQTEEQIRKLSTEVDQSPNSGNRGFMYSLGKEAIGKARECQSDVILMDVFMSEMNGSPATRHICQIPALQHVIILVIILAVSASAFEQTRQESFAAGCRDFLVKPITEDLLFDKL